MRNMTSIWCPDLDCWVSSFSASYDTATCLKCGTRNEKYIIFKNANGEKEALRTRRCKHCGNDLHRH